jgi:hypothetical protein
LATNIDPSKSERPAGLVWCKHKRVMCWYSMVQMVLVEVALAKFQTLYFAQAVSCSWSNPLHGPLGGNIDGWLIVGNGNVNPRFTRAFRALWKAWEHQVESVAKFLQLRICVGGSLHTSTSLIIIVWNQSSSAKR